MFEPGDIIQATDYLLGTGEDGKNAIEKDAICVFITQDLIKKYYYRFTLLVVDKLDNFIATENEVLLWFRKLP